MRTSGSSVLVVGDLEATRLACTLLTERGHRVRHLGAPTDRELAAVTAGDLDAVLVVVRSDVQALRYVLVTEHLRPGIRLVATVFDRTVAEQLRAAVPNCTVASPADISAPAIAAATLSRTALAITGAPGDRTVLRPAAVGGAPTVDAVPWQDARPGLGGLVGRWVPRWVGGAPGLMIGGLLGLLAVLVVDWVLGVWVLHEEPVRGLYAAARVIAGVGPASADGHGAPAWYLVVAVALMLLTIVLTGTFVAGVVDWLQSTRTLGLVGRRTLPRRGHVVVAGLGQVGLRTCLLLQELRIPVVAIERNPAADNVRLARTARIPVLIGHAEDRSVMRQVGLARARSLAALGSDDLDNVEIAISALAVVPDTRVVLRAGEDDVIAETRSLFRIGSVVDVSALTALVATLAVEGTATRACFVRDHDVHALTADGEVHLHRPRRCDCAVG